MQKAKIPIENDEIYDKATINRMSKLIGHLTATKRMMQDNRDYTEVLTQLLAVKSAINSVAKIILKNQLEKTIINAIDNNDAKELEKINKAISQFIK